MGQRMIEILLIIFLVLLLYKLLRPRRDGFFKSRVKGIGRDIADIKQQAKDNIRSYNKTRID